MNRPLTACLGACVLIGSVSAQSFFMPTDTPTAGTCNTIPFGQTSFVYQTLASASDLGNSAALDICELAFTPCTGAGIVHFDTIEVTLAQTNVAPLVSTFAANLVQNPQVVLKATNYDWHVTANRWNRMGLDKRYLYVPGNHPNLVVQVVATGVKLTGVSNTFHRDGTHQRLYALNWTGSPPATGTSGMAGLKFEISAGQADLTAFGLGCTGSNGAPDLTLTGDGKIGGSVGVSVANCVANTPVLQAIGLTRYEPEVNLVILGAKDCFLFQSVDVILGGVASSGGVYSFSTPIPNSGVPRGAKLYFQVAPADAQANKWGSTTSNYGRVLVGL